MQKLLGHLAQFGSFSMQGEVLCTQGLAYLLQDPDARSALKVEIETRTGAKIGDHLKWRAEVVQEGDKARPDLEACAANKIPVVKIEAKLGAALDGNQFRSYVADLHGRSPEGGVLLALVPRQRVREATKVVAEAFSVSGPPPWWPAEYPKVAVTVVSWDEVLNALKQAGAEPLRNEAEQLEAMYKVLSGFHIEPVAGPEVLARWRERESDFVNLVDQVSRRLTTHHSPLPMAVEPLEQAPEGFEPKGYRRRYVGRPLGAATPFFSIGVRDPFNGRTSPVWLRFHRGTANFADIRDRLDSSEFAARLVESGGHVWIPLDVPFGVGGEEMVNELVAQAEAVVQVAYQPVP